MTSTTTGEEVRAFVPDPLPPDPEILLREGQGSNQRPWEFRSSQNWIGGTRPGNAEYVPPPLERVMDCMGALETFLHNDPVRMSALLKAGLVHVQFETIHPLYAGRGRPVWRLGALNASCFCENRPRMVPVFELCPMRPIASVPQ